MMLLYMYAGVALGNNSCELESLLATERNIGINK